MDALDPSRIYNDTAPESGPDGIVRLRRGDIYAALFSDRFGEQGPGVVVTPACSLEQGKAFVVSVCPVLPLDAALAQFARLKIAKGKSGYRLEEGRLSSANATGRSAIKGWVESLAKGDVLGIHLLPGLTQDPGGEHHVVMFEQMSTAGASASAETGDFVTRVTSPYVDHLCVRFATYYLQVGTDDLTSDYVDELKSQVIDTLGSFASPKK